MYIKEMVNVYESNYPTAKSIADACDEVQNIMTSISEEVVKKNLLEGANIITISRSEKSVIFCNDKMIIEMLSLDVEKLWAIQGMGCFYGIGLEFDKERLSFYFDETICSKFSSERFEDVLDEIRDSFVDSIIDDDCIKISLNYFY